MTKEKKLKFSKALGMDIMTEKEAQKIYIEMEFEERIPINEIRVKYNISLAEAMTLRNQLPKVIGKI